jgi:hypothetical protein
VSACSECGAEKPEVPKSCNDCEFALFNDYGYSNYTVEGTEFFCTLNFHPADGFDRFYGTDNRLAFADECPMFTVGEPILMDVDRENLPELTAKQRALFDRRLS